MNVINPEQVPLHIVAELLGYFKRHHVVCVNRKNKITKIKLNWGADPLYVKGSTRDIINAAVIALDDYTSYGISLEHALFAKHRQIEKSHIRHVDPSVYRVKTVNGTYFGSGVYSASFKTNSEKIETLPSVDTGFAIENYFDVNINHGEYLIVYVYSDPGHREKVIYICK